MRTSREEVEMVERFEKIDEAEIVNLSKIDTTEGSNFHWTFGKILGMVVCIEQMTYNLNDPLTVHPRHSSLDTLPTCSSSPEDPLSSQQSTKISVPRLAMSGSSLPTSSPMLFSLHLSAVSVISLEGETSYSLPTLSVVSAV